MSFDMNAPLSRKGIAAGFGMLACDSAGVGGLMLLVTGHLVGVFVIIASLWGARTLINFMVTPAAYK